MDKLLWNLDIFWIIITFCFFHRPFDQSAVAIAPLPRVRPPRVPSQAVCPTITATPDLPTTIQLACIHKITEMVPYRSRWQASAWAPLTGEPFPSFSHMHRNKAFFFGITIRQSTLGKLGQFWFHFNCTPLTSSQHKPHCSCNSQKLIFMILTRLWEKHWFIKEAIPNTFLMLEMHSAGPVFTQSTSQQ